MVYDFQYSERTGDIIISVLVIYIGNYYVKNVHFYAWAYTINIQNVGTNTVKLLNRNWEIIDNKGIITKVQGPGVVGENPILKPGEIFEYTSGTSLKSSSGIMKGYYELMDIESNNIFNVNIPPFSLDGLNDDELPN